MGDTQEAPGTRPPWRVLLGLLVLLLVTSAGPGYAGRGSHGGGHGGHGGHGHHGFGHGHHGFGHGGHGFFGPRLGVSIWPYWDPYWAPYAAPPVVVTPPPQVSVQPAPPGTIATIPRAIIPMSNSAPVAGNRSPHHRHKSVHMRFVHLTT